ncbi:hydroxymethylbilane synthase [Candidatus Viridilinea mediisalina]|uniref:Porphobilinogen deaminase n=1 Tax=Candidatus Viridilinea mediisalina TaxID=2024553 RepID=A0A2A6RIX9_9CHLR|nr:hydroxymethylbilane synthase [Candidatus Viridilinea mediisalina]PDW02972.1 hydroxymethylbilane synthase [Candidatus Viridilinea mediisalina]
MNRSLILGTRGSKLALAQSEMMAATLRSLHPGLAVELRVISTQGDRVLDVALSAVGDKGLFVKELEQALLANEVDFCVHSCKDLPSQLPEGLTLAAFPERADPRDIIVSPLKEQGQALDLTNLRQGAVVGTSSLRRACQLRALRPDLELRDVRGNVDTRLRKLAEGQYEALVLATAGLVRLGLLQSDGTLTSDGTTFVGHALAAEQMLPAVAQGSLAIECRADDATTLALLAPLDHAATRAAALAERAFLRRLEGGCQVPIAAYAKLADDVLTLRGLVGSLDGTTIVRGEHKGSTSEAEAMGTALAEALIAQGAERILAELASSR